MTQSALRAIEGMVDQGLHPKEVAKVVVDAIDNPKPKLKYVVGKDTEEHIENGKNLSEEELFQTISQIL